MSDMSKCEKCEGQCKPTESHQYKISDLSMDDTLKCESRISAAIIIEAPEIFVGRSSSEPWLKESISILQQRRRHSSVVSQLFARVSSSSGSLKCKHTDFLDRPIRSQYIEFKLMIGEGAFGVVSKGTCFGKRCALKTLKKGVEKYSVMYERLVIESSITSQIGSHPNIVDFFGVCYEDFDAPVLVLELVDGPNLEEYLQSKQYEFKLGHAKVRKSANVKRRSFDIRWR